MKIAICDDEAYIRTEIHNLLIDISAMEDIQLEIFEFEDGEQFCSSLDKRCYDIVYLDIMMPGLGGIDTALKMRRESIDQAKIIYVTSFIEKLPETVATEPSGFITKPIQNNEFHNKFMMVRERILTEHTKIFTYRINKKMQFERVSNITYFESKGHQVFLNISDGSPKIFYDTLQNVWDEVEKYLEFVMPNKSYIVNMYHVDYLNKTCIYMKDGTEIKIGSKYKTMLLNRLNKFTGSEVTALWTT